MPSPTVVVFDVNETLSDLAPMTDRFADVGLPPHLAPTWFASVLRDGFALATTGGQARFATIADGVLRTLLAAHAPDREPQDAVGHVLQGFSALAVHPDVPAGVRALSSAGLRLVTLSNGATSVAEGLLDRAGLRSDVERLLSVEDAGAWKPATAAYEHAARECGVPLQEMMLVAVHPWDLHGAAHAGMQTAWVDRSRSPYPSYFAPPTLTVSGIDDLARRLGR